MDKRKFLKISGAAAAGLMLSPLVSCGEPDKATADSIKKTASKGAEKITSFTQATLGFDYASLEPYIDAQTMEIHFSKHHAGYVRKLNKALAAAPNFSVTGIENLLNNVTAEQTGIRNNGGGHYNHTLFWECMKPGGSKAPSGKLGEAINSSFGSQEKFEEEFYSTAKTRFGSGWAWLTTDQNGVLSVSSTANQDNPLMTNIVKEGGTPILGIDVWEHAYYLKYQNQRGSYIKAFMDVINWDVVASKYALV